MGSAHLRRSQKDKRYYMYYKPRYLKVPIQICKMHVQTSSVSVNLALSWPQQHVGGVATALYACGAVANQDPDPLCGMLINNDETRLPARPGQASSSALMYKYTHQAN